MESRLLFINKFANKSLDGLDESFDYVPSRADTVKKGSLRASVRPQLKNPEISNNRKFPLRDDVPDEFKKNMTFKNKN